MGKQATADGLNFEAMRRAIEERDAETLEGLYAKTPSCTQ